MQISRDKVVWKRWQGCFDGQADGELRVRSAAHIKRFRQYYRDHGMKYDLDRIRHDLVEPCLESYGYDIQDSKTLLKDGEYQGCIVHYTILRDNHPWAMIHIDPLSAEYGEDPPELLADCGAEMSSVQWVGVTNGLSWSWWGFYDRRAVVEIAPVVIVGDPAHYMGYDR